MAAYPLFTVLEPFSKLLFSKLLPLSIEPLTAALELMASYSFS